MARAGRILAALLGLSCSMAMGESPYENSYALVVGIDEYQSGEWDRLSYAVKDAEGVAGLLAAKGFTVIALYDEEATRRGILQALELEIAPQLGADDRVVFFFAGHGHTERFDGREKGYIVPHDGVATFDYIPMEELQRQSLIMDAAKHHLFIMDACYGGLLSLRGVRRLSDDRPGYLKDLTRRRARHVLTAGGPDQQVVDGGAGEHSVFTGALLEAIGEGKADTDGDGWITFAEIDSYVTPRASNDFQTPAVSNFPRHQTGQLVFRSPQRRRAQETSGPGSQTLDELGAAASFTVQAGSDLSLQVSSFDCTAANDPRKVDEIFIEVEGRTPANRPYSKRFGTWEGVCRNPLAVPLPIELWAGRLGQNDRLFLNVWIREEDKHSGPEDILAFQFDASADSDGNVLVDLVGLPVLEDTQRKRQEMAITRIENAGALSTAHSATISVDYTRRLLFRKHRVAYEATIAW